MKRRLLSACGVVALWIAGSTGSAFAHAGLTSCSIKDHQVFTVAHAPHSITAHFAEPLDPGKSWMAVFEGVADHGLVTEKQHLVVNYKNPRVMTLQLPKLSRDRYYVIWYTHSAADSHVAAGIVYFQVK